MPANRTASLRIAYDGSSIRCVSMPALQPRKREMRCHEMLQAYAQFRRARIALPITQSLSSSDRNVSSSVKCVMRCW